MKKHRGLFKKNDPRTAKGGKRNPPGGRPTKLQQEVKKAVAQIVQGYIEEHIKPVLESYFKLTQGREVKHYDHKGKLAYTEEVIDGSTVRHWIDKFVPPAKQEFYFTGDFKTKIRQEVIDRILKRKQ